MDLLLCKSYSRKHISEERGGTDKLSTAKKRQVIAVAGECLTHPSTAFGVAEVVGVSGTVPTVRSGLVMSVIFTILSTYEEPQTATQVLLNVPDSFPLPAV